MRTPRVSQPQSRRPSSCFDSGDRHHGRKCSILTRCCSINRRAVAGDGIPSAPHDIRVKYAIQSIFSFLIGVDFDARNKLQAWQLG